MQNRNSIDELDQNYYNSRPINLSVNELTNTNEEFVNLYMGASPISSTKTNSNLVFFEDYDNLSTKTKEIESDLFSINSNDSTVIFEIKENNKFKLFNKIKKLLFK